MKRTFNGPARFKKSAIKFHKSSASSSAVPTVFLSILLSLFSRAAVNFALNCASVLGTLIHLPPAATFCFAACL